MQANMYKAYGYGGFPPHPQATAFGDNWRGANAKVKNPPSDLFLFKFWGRDGCGCNMLVTYFFLCFFFQRHLLFFVLSK